MDELTILTPLEFKVMDILWRLEKAYVKDILDSWPEENKPAYNTISTIVRILQDKKGYIKHESHGRNHLYVPNVDRVTYKEFYLKSAVKSVFQGSVSSLLSTLIGNEKVEQKELNELKKLLGIK